MTNKEIKLLLTALRIAFIGALVLIPIATAVSDIITALIAIGLTLSIAIAYPLIQRELN